MKQLLSKIPDSRLGDSFAALYNHPWFGTVEWVMTSVTQDQLLAKKLKMPYIIPANKLVNVKGLLEKRLTRIQDELVTSVSRKCTRKDFVPDWDRCF